MQDAACSSRQHWQAYPFWPCLLRNNCYLIEQGYSKGNALVTSPCTLVCTIDMASGYCFGCGRTREEITQWMDMSEKQRLQVMATLPPRLDVIERKPRRETRRRRMHREAGGGNFPS